MGVRHGADAIAAVLGDGETRLVWARWRDRPEEPLVFLPDGGAAALKESTPAGALECFMPVCEDRRLSVVDRSGGGRRDGFRHRSGAGGHTPESLMHEQGKAVVAAWARDTLGDAAAVELEARVGGGVRVADVLVTWRGSGARVAFEVQCAGLQVSRWRTRHEAYRALGIVDVWLFGHLPPHLIPPRGDVRSTVTTTSSSRGGRRGVRRRAAAGAVPAVRP